MSEQQGQKVFCSKHERERIPSGSVRTLVLSYSKQQIAKCPQEYSLYV